MVENLHLGKDLREQLVQLLVQKWKWRSGGWAVCGGRGGVTLPPDLCLAEIREGEWAVLGLLGGQPEGLGSDMV